MPTLRSVLLATMLVLPLVLVAGRGEAATPESYHVVVPQRAFGPLDGAEVRLHPVPSEEFGVTWSGVSKRKRDTRAGAWFQAPYVIRADQSTARIVATLTSREGSFEVVAEVPLIAGSFPGAEGCLASGQSFSESEPEIVPPFTSVDELPSRIRSTPPRTPKGIRPDQLPRTIMVNVLVCRTGRVIDAWAPQAFGRDPSTGGPGEPIENDPRLVAAAIEWALQSVFKPALSGGVPIATWVAIPVRFAE